jgi:hypothetical protein
MKLQDRDDQGDLKIRMPGGIEAWGTTPEMRGGFAKCKSQSRRSHAWFYASPPRLF